MADETHTDALSPPAEVVEQKVESVAFEHKEDQKAEKLNKLSSGFLGGKKGK
ncbi:MAG: hypothetical protein WCH01_15540 [Methylococcaceae bacterium]